MGALEKPDIVLSPTQPAFVPGTVCIELSVIVVLKFITAEVNM